MVVAEVGGGGGGTNGMRVRVMMPPCCSLFDFG